MFAVPKHKKNPLVLIGAGLGVRAIGRSCLGFADAAVRRLGWPGATGKRTGERV
jgi:hypothetical protein